LSQKKPKHVKIPLPENAHGPVFSFCLYVTQDGNLDVGFRWHARQIPLETIKPAVGMAVMNLTPQDFQDASVEAQALADEALEKQ
jgi:hypothetical protein